jgi:hypothetical protein
VALIAAGKADAAEKFWRSYMMDTADFMEKNGLASLRVVAPQTNFSSRPGIFGSRNVVRCCGRVLVDPARGAGS